MAESPLLADHLRSAPFELILSSGFFGFYAHAGVIDALEEAELRPSLVGGSSAGALVAGLWAAGLDAATIRDRLLGLRREDFWDPDPLLGVGHHLPLPAELRALLSPPQGYEKRGPGLLRGQAFDALLDAAFAELGVRTFADCRIPLRVVVHDLTQNKPVVLEQGELRPAVRASCSLPGLFQPVHIEGTLYLDGGIADRAGILAATPGTRLLYHHLPAKSPWRLVMRGQNAPPVRPDMYIVFEPGLPRLGPFSLELGARAHELARAATRRALRTPAHLCASRTPQKH
jgi:NTE family protein